MGIYVIFFFGGGGGGGGGGGLDGLIRSKFKVRNIYSFISIVLALYKFSSSSSSSI